MIKLGKKSMEVEQLFNSLGGIVYKPLKVTINASETPKETVINVHVTVQADYTPLWR